MSQWLKDFSDFVCHFNVKEAGFTSITIGKHFVHLYTFSVCNTAVIFIVLCKNPLCYQIMSHSASYSVLLLSILKTCVLANDSVLLSLSVLALLVTGIIIISSCLESRRH